MDSSEAGRRLGQIRTEAKAKSSRANGRLGGRPQGTTATPSTAVKRVRLKRGWSKTEMAIAMDCTAHTVARLERDGVLPAHGAILEAFLKLAAESEVSLEEPED